jgi:hypothetical protein
LDDRFEKSTTSFNLKISSLKAAFEDEHRKFELVSQQKTELQLKHDSESKGRTEALSLLAAAKQELARLQIEHDNQVATMKAKYEEQIMKLGSEKAGGGSDLLRAKVCSLQDELAAAKVKISSLQQNYGLNPFQPTPTASPAFHLKRKNPSLALNFSTESEQTPGAVSQASKERNTRGSKALSSSSNKDW